MFVRPIASYLVGHDKYLIEFLVRNKPLLASNFDAIIYRVGWRNVG